MALACREVKIVGENTRKREKKQHKYYLGAHNAKVAYALSYVQPASCGLHLHATYPKFKLRIVIIEMTPTDQQRLTY